jgi:hypothetical protein
VVGFDVREGICRLRSFWGFIVACVDLVLVWCRWCGLWCDGICPERNGSAGLKGNRCEWLIPKKRTHRPRLPGNTIY